MQLLEDVRHCAEEVCFVQQDTQLSCQWQQHRHIQQAAVSEPSPTFRVICCPICACLGMGSRQPARLASEAATILGQD